MNKDREEQKEQRKKIEIEKTEGTNIIRDREEQTERREIETDRARGNEEKKRQTGQR
jgi:hypothetical protein